MAVISRWILLCSGAESITPIRQGSLTQENHVIVCPKQVN